MFWWWLAAWSFLFSLMKIRNCFVWMRSGIIANSHFKVFSLGRQESRKFKFGNWNYMWNCIYYIITRASTRQMTACNVLPLFQINIVSNPSTRKPIIAHRPTKRPRKRTDSGMTTHVRKRLMTWRKRNVLQFKLPAGQRSTGRPI